MPAFVLMKTILVPSPKPNTSKSVTGGNGYHGIQLDDLVLDPLLDAIRTNSSRPP